MVPTKRSTKRDIKLKYILVLIGLLPLVVIYCNINYCQNATSTSKNKIAVPVVHQTLNANDSHDMQENDYFSMQLENGMKEMQTTMSVFQKELEDSITEQTGDIEVSRDEARYVILFSYLLNKC